MGIIEDLMGGLSGAEGATHPQLAQAMGGLLGGGREHPAISLEEVVERLRAVGCGGQVASWLGDGTNMPLAPDQLYAALGEHDSRAMADSAGMPMDNFLAVLAEHLPGLIDRLSPRGELNPAGAGGTSTTV